MAVGSKVNTSSSLPDFSAEYLHEIQSVQNVISLKINAYRFLVKQDS